MCGGCANAGPDATKRSLWFHGNQHLPSPTPNPPSPHPLSSPEAPTPERLDPDVVGTRRPRGHAEPNLPVQIQPMRRQGFKVGNRTKKRPRDDSVEMSGPPGLQLQETASTRDVLTGVMFKWLESKTKKKNTNISVLMLVVSFKANC